MCTKSIPASENEVRWFSKDVTLSLKGIAILLMLIHHLFSCFPDFVEKYKVSSLLLPMDKVMGLSTLSKLCVAVFVFLSAYGMTVSFCQSRGPRPDSGVIKRYKKLALGFFLVYVLSILTSFLRQGGIGIYFSQGKARGLSYMLLDALGLSAFFTTPTYNETWWYMSVAILLVFAAPVFIRLYEKFGVSALVIAGMLQYLGIPLTAFTSYLFAMFLGICAAEEGVVSRLAKGLGVRRRLPFLIGNGLVILLLCLVRLKWGYEYWLDAFAALLCAMELFVLIDLLHIRLRPLAFLGKYSMNIFLVHTLIFEYYFTDFIYSFRNWVLITLALLVASLAVSIGIEAIKKRLLPLLGM